MRFDLVTIFPEFFAGPLDHGIVRRARETGLVEVQVQDLREFTKDRHRSVDDRPFGGGEGMVLKPEPLFEAAEALLGARPGNADQPLELDSMTAILLLSAAGKLFRQENARRYAKLNRVILLCGRYEGVDERVAEHLATEEISVGDFVLSGGELPAMMVIDAVTRLVPGALGNEASSQNESFSDPELAAELQEFRPSPEASLGSVPSVRRIYESLNLRSGLLDYPHYTRPAEYRGWAVPEVLLSGNHEEIRAWRQQAALRKTLKNRPDLLGPALLKKAASSLREV
ncbi:MAG TPA: tRNA (guanosine(37)-N1)-methyltransferase TrmD [Candidatus Methylomirabilis sp.]|nr:tRNA (guanosine(37)-N1)-methyltransferase TrmD [Candidatus Methylomirabilis sp.]